MRIDQSHVDVDDLISDLNDTPKPQSSAVPSKSGRPASSTLQKQRQAHKEAAQMKVQGTKVAGFSAQNSKSNLAVPSINSARRENSSMEMNTASKDSTTQANTSRMPESTENVTEDTVTEVESVQPFQTPD